LHTLPRILGLAVPLFFLGSACSDSVGCVFVEGGCDPDTLSPNPAAQPVDGEWILPAAPEVVTTLPSGSGHAGTTPVVVVFNETMQLASLPGAFEIIQEGGFAQPIRVAEAVLSEGRVLVLLPSTMDPFDPGTYVVRRSEDAQPVDLSGQELDLAAGDEVGRFTVATTVPDEPRLVTTFPEDQAEGQGQSLELVVVFDRPIEADSVTPASFDVRVAGAQPVPDPPATALRLGAQGVPDTRVFSYQRVDADGLPLAFGNNVEVQIRLSPVGDEITDTDEDPDALESVTVEFRTAAIAPPLSASLLSDPFDAIGLANLTDGNPEELAVEVELDMAQPGDVLDLYVFGVERSEEADPPLIATLSTKRLSGSAPIQSAIFMREEVGLQLSNAPGDVRFADGALTFAFTLRRGSVTTPVRVLDLDPEPDTILDPELDTTPPVLRFWSGTGATSTYRSDVRDLGLAGEADERVRGVEVETELGSNGALAPVLGADESGLFLADPVEVGRIDDGTTSFSAVLRDRAQNPAPAVNGDFIQLGSLGPAAFTPGQTLEVEVFAADTLAALPNARVLVHSDLGNGTDYPFFVAGTTGLDGRVQVATASAPSVAAIVTVVLAGHDLFTLHGVPTMRLSVPLRPTALATAQASGEVATRAPDALSIAGFEQRFDDSRRAVELPRGFAGDSCQLEGEELQCPYGDEPIRPGPLGARSFFAGDFSLAGAAVDPAEFLQAFALLLPLRGAASGANQAARLDLPGLLEASTDPEDAAQALPPFQFRLPASSGLVPPFQDDPETPGLLFGTVETRVPGLPGSIAVGPCASIPIGADLWTVLGAYPGAITAEGSLGGAGTVDSDPSVRVELLDSLGSASGVRPRLSTLLAGPMNPEFVGLPRGDRPST
jgi:hypothetical protein